MDGGDGGVSSYDRYVSLSPFSEGSIQLRNEFNFWNVHGTMNISGLLQSWASR